MELRFANDTDNLQELWQTCFPPDDGEPFFTREYARERALVVENDDGLIVSMLHFTLQTLTMWNVEIPVAYMLGVCTHPEYRKQGLAGDLVEQLLFELHLRKIPLAVLIPENEGVVRFYEKYGFCQVGIRQNIENTVIDNVQPVTVGLSKINEQYEKCFGAVPHLRRTNEQWKSIAAEYRIEAFADGYCAYDGDNLLECSFTQSFYKHHLGACFKIIESKHMLSLAAERGLSLSGLFLDDYCPWNDTTGDDSESVVLEEILFKDNEPYINLLHNGG